MSFVLGRMVDKYFHSQSLMEADQSPPKVQGGGGGKAGTAQGKDQKQRGEARRKHRAGTQPKQGDLLHEKISPAHRRVIKFPRTDPKLESPRLIAGGWGRRGRAPGQLWRSAWQAVLANTGLECSQPVSKHAASDVDEKYFLFLCKMRKTDNVLL